MYNVFYIWKLSNSIKKAHQISNEILPIKSFLLDTGENYKCDTTKLKKKSKPYVLVCRKSYFKNKNCYLSNYVGNIKYRKRVFSSTPVK